MANSAIKHFDYLIDFDADLEAALGLSDLSKDINYWRCSGTERPDDALRGCRIVLETALKELTRPLPDSRMNLKEIIEYAENESILDHPMALKCNEIRMKGNKASHEYKSVKAVDAKMVLELLDDFLRWNATRLHLIPATPPDASIQDDPVFIVRPEEEIASMSRTARLASAFAADKEIEKKAQRAKSQATSYNDSSASDLDTMKQLIEQAEAIGAAASARHDKRVQATRKRLLKQCDKNLETLNEEKRSIDESIDEVNAEIEEILSEHDFIKKLLKGDNRATERQLNVMAFPRGSNTVTNILQIAGSAGTGKTLCLLAKIISEIDNHGQAQLFGAPKTALFICFNKGLANYVRSILARCGEELPYIEVAHYDEFINQLVRKKPKAGFEHLAQYASDVRYENDRIIYGFDDLYVQLLKDAQAAVAKRHPDQTNEYYLSSSDEEGFQWLKDELVWIEARFSSDRDAEVNYPQAERIGRGTNRRPNANIRLIILEIRRELNRLLKQRHRYTIEQATKRLLSSDELPAYDAIAIDEVQDFSLLSIRLLLKFRRNASSKVFLSGDENQKIYQRDFTWKELDEGLRGYTITLRKNMRNSAAIRRFSDRLLGITCPYEKASHFVYVQNADDARTVELLRSLSNPKRSETTVLISNNRNWARLLRERHVSIRNAAPGDIYGPGLYLMGDRMGKGLEFDNVVVDYTGETDMDEETEKRLRYVHFTRARKRLYVRYSGKPPKLLTEYYADFLG